MKDLKQYIVEATTSQKTFFAETFIKTLSNSQLTKDKIIGMLTDLDNDLLMSLSKYLEKTDNSNYLAYLPNKDEFINKDAHDKIINQMSEYLYKYICQK